MSYYKIEKQKLEQNLKEVMQMTSVPSSPTCTKPMLPAVLRLTIKKRWYDMIKSGIKKEEYRECKDYWVSRLMHFKYDGTPYCLPHMVKWYDEIEFINGYSKNAPRMRVEFNGLKIGNAVAEWSDNWQGNVFIIKLGNVLSVIE